MRLSCKLWASLPLSDIVLFVSFCFFLQFLKLQGFLFFSFCPRRAVFKLSHALKSSFAAIVFLLAMGLTHCSVPLMLGGGMCLRLAGRMGVGNNARHLQAWPISLPNIFLLPPLSQDPAEALGLQCMLKESLTQYICFNHQLVTKATVKLPGLLFLGGYKCRLLFFSFNFSLRKSSFSQCLLLDLPISI